MTTEIITGLYCPRCDQSTVHRIGKQINHLGQIPVNCIFPSFMTIALKGTEELLELFTDLENSINMESD